jgi:hypothetical protein
LSILQKLYLSKILKDKLFLENYLITHLKLKFWIFMMCLGSKSDTGITFLWAE